LSDISDVQRGLQPGSASRGRYQPTSLMTELSISRPASRYVSKLHSLVRDSTLEAASKRCVLIHARGEGSAHAGVVGGVGTVGPRPALIDRVLEDGRVPLVAISHAIFSAPIPPATSRHRAVSTLTPLTKSAWYDRPVESPWARTRTLSSFLQGWSSEST
jgi:hypothetical protein